jgi:hypothetical protein
MQENLMESTTVDELTHLSKENFLHKGLMVSQWVRVKNLRRYVQGRYCIASDLSAMIFQFQLKLVQA